MNKRGRVIKKVVRKLAAGIVSVLLLLGITGCATTKYTTHYGFFEAENSEGELRQFRVIWETGVVQDWGKRRRFASPIRLETQCSSRTISFYDTNFPAQTKCVNNEHAGIVYCGNERRDRDRRGMDIVPNSVCARVSDRKGARNILSLGDEIKLSVVCQPSKTQVRKDGKWLNQDSIMPSNLPYVVATTTLPGRDRDGHVPQLWNHSSVCDPLQAR